MLSSSWAPSGCSGHLRARKRLQVAIAQLSKSEKGLAPAALSDLQWITVPQAAGPKLWGQQRQVAAQRQSLKSCAGRAVAGPLMRPMT